MARFKYSNHKQGHILLVIPEEQLIPGTLEHSVDYLLEHHLDLFPLRICQESMVLIALIGDYQPDHATIARFILKLEPQLPSTVVKYPPMLLKNPAEPSMSWRRKKQSSKASLLS